MTGPALTGKPMNRTAIPGRPPDPADAVLKALRAHRHILVTTHARADGDAIGSALAAAALLRALGKTVQVVHEGPLTEELRGLPGTDTVGFGARAVRPGFDALLVLDATGLDRCEGLRVAFPPGLFTINIDHHKTNARFGDVNWVDPTAAATGELVWRLVRKAGIRPGRDLATNLYAAILTDTGRFSFSNTTPRTLQTAAELLACGVRPGEVTRQIYRNRSREDLLLLGACLRAVRFSGDGRLGWLWLTRAMVRRHGTRPRDSQEYIDLVKSVRGVSLAVLFRDTEEPGAVKVSVRTEPDVDATALVGPFGGGGHPRAAGATVRGTPRDVERRVLAAARRLLRSSSPASKGRP
jgi:phosphoesterase RecJ-like protein